MADKAKPWPPQKTARELYGGTSASSSGLPVPDDQRRGVFEVEEPQREASTSHEQHEPARSDKASQDALNLARVKAQEAFAKVQGSSAAKALPEQQGPPLVKTEPRSRKSSWHSPTEGDFEAPQVSAATKAPTTMPEAEGNEATTSREGGKRRKAGGG